MAHLVSCGSPLPRRTRGCWMMMESQFEPAGWSHEITALSWTNMSCPPSLFSEFPTCVCDCYSVSPWIFHRHSDSTSFPHTIRNLIFHSTWPAIYPVLQTRYLGITRLLSHLLYLYIIWAKYNILHHFLLPPPHSSQHNFSPEVVTLLVSYYPLMSITFNPFLCTCSI